jgi:predicted RNA binding protein YcfA (HicA-like mRNA interferase family)
MAGDLPSVTPRKIERVLLARGFLLKPHRGKGAHRVYHHPGTGQRTMVSFHHGDIPKGTLRLIMRQAGLTAEDLRK